MKENTSKNLLVSYEDLISLVKEYLNEQAVLNIDKYYKEALLIYKDMKRLTGEDYINHGIRVALSLASLKMDDVTLGCALIHEAILLEKRTYEEIEETFGEESACILSCITKISLLKRTFTKDNSDRYRKIIVGLSDNPKALFIKLADRLDNIKTINVHDINHQKEIIKETKDVYIPIVHRLGIKIFKQEFEDIILRLTKPNEYNNVLKLIDASRESLEKDLNKMKEDLSYLLNEHNISFTITSRVKSVNGIYVKLENGRKFTEIYDLLGLRIIVDRIEQCYLILGLIHSRYQSIAKRFKDYIGNPKGNMYQSLHTTVFGVNDRMYEVQIRTYEMDAIAESGVASHWSYKEHIDGKVKTSVETRLETFKALIDVNNETNNTKFFSNLSSELNKEQIYVFTPKGDAIELPTGSTPIDFAYRIHSAVGDTTVGAIVNNKIEKLDYKLQDGDVVNLLTEKGKHPNKAWLKSVKTQQAYSRIKAYFSKLEKEKFIAFGKDLFEKEVKKQKFSVSDALKEENIKKLLKEYNLSSIEELYFNIYNLKYTAKEIVRFIFDIKDEEEIKYKFSKDISKKRNNNIIVGETADILTLMASCCNPVYGDEIIGYITKGEGIKIHRKSCSNIDENSERLIGASWKKATDEKYVSVLEIYHDEKDINIVDIVTIATKNDINVLSLNEKNNKTGNFYEIKCNVKDIESLNSFINEVSALKYVLNVQRRHE